MLLGFFGLSLFAQELEMSPTEKAPRKLAKNTFESVWIIDNQTVMVPIRGTLEFDILHRFGKVNNDGDFDLFGLFAPSNIRMGLSYTPINNLQVGVGLTKDRTILDGSLKYAILKQTADSWAMPVSLTYYGNMGVDLKEDPDNSLYQHNSDRFRYFHQLIIARKITSKLSLQVAPSISWQNFVYGYFKTVEVDSVTTRKEVAEEMEHAHFALAFSGRYKLTESIALMVNYTSPGMGLAMLWTAAVFALIGGVVMIVQAFRQRSA